MREIQKILIANRGEIAVRIMQTAKSMGIRTVAIYAEHEGRTMHRDQADEAWSLGTGDLAGTYLNIQLILDIAQKSRADAIHPGYGFLSENPLLAKACRQKGIVFIGPSEKAIRIMGNKLEAAHFVQSLDIPLLDLKTGTPAKLIQMVNPEEFPVMIKAAAGGGGKGMRIVYQPENLKEALAATTREAEKYFGNPQVYIEKYLEKPKHIEIQILADEHGNYIHLFERECSLQRRHQKIIEEAPSPSLDAQTREKMGSQAVRIAREIGYTGAGTVEFLLDPQQGFFFLEMNTRIQVEHPVTEMITGVDLVREQISIAMGYTLSYEQSQLTIRGHAIEARIYAEDPANHFMPYPGHISRFTIPRDQAIRTDTGVRSTDEISAHYDPMIAKVIAWDEERNQAITRLRTTLEQTVITGIRTNRAYLKEILQHPKFIGNQFTTQFIEDHHHELVGHINKHLEKQAPQPLLAAYIFIHSLPRQHQTHEQAWQALGYWRPHMHWDIQLNENLYSCHFERINHSLSLTLNGEKHSFKLIETGTDWVTIESEQSKSLIYFSGNNRETEMAVSGTTHIASHWRYLEALQNKKAIHLHQQASGNINSPMFGKVLSIKVGEKMNVRKGQTLMILEAMKMENNIQAPRDITIKHIAVKEGDQVEDGQLLVETSK